jgi:glycosyltransferase involved in cell wall biosynthesis
MEVAPPTATATGLRVLQVGPLYVNHVRRWSEHAVALGHTVCAAGHVRPERRLVDLGGLAEHVEVAPPQIGELGTPARVAWLRKLVRSLDPDLIQAHYLATWGCYATLAGNRPVVVTPWGSDLYRSTGIWRRNVDRALRKADRVLARSPHMRRELHARGVPAGRIDEVDLGVDLDRFRPPPQRQRAQALRELDLPPGPVILSPRAGTSLYNLDVVVEAFRILRERHRDATLLMVHGDAPLSRALRSSLHGVGREDGIRAIGHVSHGEMPTYLSVATAGVSIPSSDGSPSSVWEALASGVPMVLSRLPQMTERVGGSGAVRLVEPRPDAVASALLEIADDPRLRGEMASAGRTWALANADHRHQSTRLGRAYAAAMRGRGARSTAPSAAPGSELGLRSHGPEPAPAAAEDRPREPDTARAGAAPLHPN